MHEKTLALLVNFLLNKGKFGSIYQQNEVMDIQLGRLKKKKARGAQWEGERLLLFLLGYPAGASAEERESSMWHLSRWLRFLGEIWC